MNSYNQSYQLDSSDGSDSEVDASPFWRLRKICWIPIIFPAVALPTFLITYGIAVYNGHVRALWPYISDTASLPPESCIFSQFLNIAIFFLCLTVYVRYMQIKEAIDRAAGAPDEVKLRWCNRAAGVSGAFVCLGISMVANFQKTSLRVPHITGALAYMVAGAVFCGLQTYFSWKWKRVISPPWLFYFRACLTIFIWILTVIVPVCGHISRSIFKNSGYSNDLLWAPHQEGYALHVVASASEWVLVVLHAFYIGSFTSDFRLVALRRPFLRMVNEPETIATAINPPQAASSTHARVIPRRSRDPTQKQRPLSVKA